MNPNQDIVAKAMADQMMGNQDWYQNALMNQANNRRMVFSSLGGPPQSQPGYRPYDPQGLFGLGSQGY